jgi:hypothetical protein
MLQKTCQLRRPGSINSVPFAWPKCFRHGCICGIQLAVLVWMAGARPEQCVLTDLCCFPVLTLAKDVVTGLMREMPQPSQAARARGSAGRGSWQASTFSGVCLALKLSPIESSAEQKSCKFCYVVEPLCFHAWTHLLPRWVSAVS